MIDMLRALPGRSIRLRQKQSAVWWLLVIAFASMHVNATEHARTHVELSDERIHIAQFSPQVELLEDASGDLTIDEVSAPAHSARFIPATASSANVGFTESAWWVRFTLRNPTDVERQMFVRQSYPLIDYLDFYARDSSDEWQRHATGDRRLFASREVAHRDFVFSLAVPAHTDRTFYLRYESQGPIDISLSLYTAPELIADVSREQIAFGVYFGCVMMLLVWSGLVYAAVRDNAFFAYFAYVATFGLYMLVNNGVAFQYLWPNSPAWGNTSLVVLLNLAGFAALQFSRVILRSKDYTPKLDRAARAMQGVFVCSLLVTPLLAYAQLIVPLTMLILATVIFMLVLGTASMLAGSKPARFYLLAWSSFLAGSIVFLLKTFGVFPHTFFTHNGWQIGSLLEMILLSMTLSSRMNELKHESRTDSLTLLGNRRSFDDQLASEFALANQSHRPLSLLMLDIDHFKNYNDRHGHAQGDEAIKIVANALKRHVRKPFTACRYGGEEFTVILPGVDAPAAAALAERLRAAVEESLSGDQAITVSVGYASLSQTQFEKAEKLFEAADFALYSAKQQGRNRVVGFKPRRSVDRVTVAS